MDRLTVVDFSYLHAQRGLLGESWLCDIELAGEPDAQGKLLNIGTEKRSVKRLIDEHFDHTLIVPRRHPGLVLDATADRSWRLSTGTDRSEDEYMNYLDYFFRISKVKVQDLQGVGLASVVPNKTFIFEKMCDKYLGIKPVVVSHELKLGLKILYSDPSQVGADRICNAVASYQRYKPAVVVVTISVPPLPLTW